MLDIAFLQGLGYLGVFLGGFFSTFLLFLPSPTFVLVILLSTTLNPLLLGIAGGLGAAIGEMIGYGIGYGFRYATESRYGKWMERAKNIINKYRPSVVIFVFAATPLPFDLVGLFCGTINYSRKKFFVATFSGKLVKYLLLAYA